MKTLIKIEELFMWCIATVALYEFNAAWWWYFLLLLGPDISMLGYWMNDKKGAKIYNLFHHKGIAILFFIVGFYFYIDFVKLVGIILFGHASMDRLFGFGLKYHQGFNYTHLGIIGKHKK